MSVNSHGATLFPALDRDPMLRRNASLDRKRKTALAHSRQAIFLRFIAAGLLAFAVSCSPAVQAQAAPSADLIVSNAKIWTVDRSLPQAQAVAVLGDRIVAVGSNSDVEPWRVSRTRVINARGKLLLPGFIDAHV